MTKSRETLSRKTKFEKTKVQCDQIKVDWFHQDWDTKYRAQKRPRWRCEWTLWKIKIWNGIFSARDCFICKWLQWLTSLLITNFHVCLYELIFQCKNRFFCINFILVYNRIQRIQPDRCWFGIQWLTWNFAWFQRTCFNWHLQCNYFLFKNTK